MMAEKGKTVLRKHWDVEGFEYVRMLGSGGFAETHLFKDLNRQYSDYVVFKIPHPRDKDFQLALLRGDIASLAALKGIPYIAQFFDVKIVDDRFALVMEYIDGPVLRDLISHPRRSIRLPIEKTVTYVCQVAQGLQAAHSRDVVHRDIKPENIIIDKSSESVKILDFGIASLMPKGKGFKTELIRHTPGYTAPEIFREGKGDHRVDIYSLGVTFYEMLTGQLPFQKGKALAPRALNKRIPVYLENVILKAIASDPGMRFKDISEFIQAIEPPKELKEAREKMATRELRRAEAILRMLIRRRPDDLRGFMELANLLNRSCRPAEALEVFRAALEVEPEDVEGHICTAATLIQLGEMQQAARHLQTAEALSPNRRSEREIKLLKAKLCAKK